MSFSAARSLSWLGCAAAIAVLSACAPLPSHVEPVGRTLVSLDQNADLQWAYWGTDNEVLDVLPDDLAKDKPLQARLWQMRTKLGELVGVMSLRSNVDDLNNKNTVWTQDCPKQKGVLVERTQGLNIGRVDCLRIKRTANSSDWMAQNDAAMASRLESAGVYFARPVAYVSYQFSTSNGGYVEAQVLVDQRLVRPPIRSSVDFLAAGRSLDRWAQDLARSMRESTGYFNGVLTVPPFPYEIDQQPYYATKQDDSDTLFAKEKPNPQAAEEKAASVVAPAGTAPAGAAPAKR